MQEGTRQGMRGKGGELMSSPRALPSKYLHVLNSQEVLLEPLWLLGFSRRLCYIGAQLIRIIVLVINSASSQVKGKDWKFQRLAAEPSCVPAQPSSSYHISINTGMVERDLSWITKAALFPCRLRNFKGFRSTVPRTGDKSKIFLIVSQYHRWGWSKLWMYNPHLIGNWVNCLIHPIILERSWFLELHCSYFIKSSPCTQISPAKSHVDSVRKNSTFRDTHNIREKWRENSCIITAAQLQLKLDSASLKLAPGLPCWHFKGISL